MNHPQKVTIEALAEIIASQVKGVSPLPPQLRVVDAPKPTKFDSITRESIVRRVRWLSRVYGLSCLVEQATFDSPGLECLCDEQLTQLLRDLEQARENMANGIDLETAGLIRDLSRNFDP